MPLTTADLEQTLAPYRDADRWLVAFSGGMDSLALLHAVAGLTRPPPLRAVHINHRLQPQSDTWEQQCRETAQALGVDFRALAVTVPPSSPAGPEEAARRARYAALEGLLQTGDVLLMAHHLDDQVETLMLRLLRGSGSPGLAAMPAVRALGPGRLVRPLLDCTRADIEHYVRRRDLPWIEDPSNRDPRFDRNYLRQRVLPVIAERWPGYRQTLGRAAALSEESAQLDRELAEQDCHALALSPLAPSLPVAALEELSPGRCRNLLRHWLQQRGLPTPSMAQLQVLMDEVVGARGDAVPLLEWPGAQLRRFRGELHAMPPLAAFEPERRWPLSPAVPVAVPGVGTVALEAGRGGGIAVDYLRDGAVEVRFRRGGERCRPRGRAGSQMLKKLLQEYGVEPWLRDRVPLVYIRDELAAVGDYWVCEPFAAAAGEDAYHCRWERAIYQQ